MRNLIYLLISFLLSKSSLAQEERIRVNNHEFSCVTEVVGNEWGTKDTLTKLYWIENGKQTYVLKFFPFKDEGGDCNNLFWNTETMEIKNDKILFITKYEQKTGMDPIFEQRKQIYRVGEDGKLTLIFDKYMPHNGTEWVSNE